MGIGTKSAPKVMQDRLATVVDEYRVLLCADERRLLEAMREYERSCWDKLHVVQPR